MVIAHEHEETARTAYAVVDELEGWAIGACSEGARGYRLEPGYMLYSNRSFVGAHVDSMN